MLWLNPPYGRQIGKWIDKLVSEYEAEQIGAALVLVPNRNTRWFRRVSNFPRAVMNRRLVFWQPDGEKSGAPGELVHVEPVMS